MRRGLAVVAWAAALLLCRGAAFAQTQPAGREESTEQPAQEPGAQQKTVLQPQPEAESTKPWYLYGSIDLRSQYFFRGYNQNSHGYIVQPNAEFGYTVYDNGTFSLTPFVGTWLNLTQQRGPGSPAHFNELDYIGGVDLIIKEKLTLRFLYTDYTSPSDAFEDIQELGLNLKYDGLPLGPFEKLNPAVGYYTEIQNKAETEHAYLEFGVEPTLAEIKLANVPVTLSFPTLLGTSLDTFYTGAGGHNAFWGFAQAGVKASVPVSVDKKWGEWTLSAEVDYVYLFANSVRAANTGDDDDVVLVGSLTYSF